MMSLAKLEARINRLEAIERNKRSVEREILKRQKRLIEAGIGPINAWYQAKESVIEFAVSLDNSLDTLTYWENGQRG